METRYRAYDGAEHALSEAMRRSVPHKDSLSPPEGYLMLFNFTSDPSGAFINGRAYVGGVNCDYYPPSLEGGLGDEYTRAQCPVGSSRERAYYYQLDLGRSDLEIKKIFTQGADWGGLDHFFLGDFQVALTDTAEEGLKRCMTAPDMWRTTLDTAVDTDATGARFTEGDTRRRVLGFNHSNLNDWTYTTSNGGFSTLGTEY